MANDLKTARLQMAELSERLQRLNRDLQLTQDAISRGQAEYHRLEGKIAALTAKRTPKGKARTEKRANNPKRGAVADAALSAIRAAGKPLTRAELYDRLTAEGLQIEGADPVMVFSTMLWRERDRIARLRGFGYWPADRPYLPAGFMPDGQASLL